MNDRVNGTSRSRNSPTPTTTETAAARGKAEHQSWGQQTLAVPMSTRLLAFHLESLAIEAMIHVIQVLEPTEVEVAAQARPLLRSKPAKVMSCSRLYVVGGGSAETEHARRAHLLGIMFGEEVRRECAAELLSLVDPSWTKNVKLVGSARDGDAFNGPSIADWETTTAAA